MTILTKGEVSGMLEIMALDVTLPDWSSVITNLTSMITPANVVTVMATLASAGVGFAFLYWGVRKAVRSLMAAFKRGRISL